jgi:hypothetical protein
MIKPEAILAVLPVPEYVQDWIKMPSLCYSIEKNRFNVNYQPEELANRFGGKGVELKVILRTLGIKIIDDD